MTAPTLARIRRHPHLLAEDLAPLLDTTPARIEAVRELDAMRKGKRRPAMDHRPWTRSEVARLSACLTAVDAILEQPDRSPEMVIRRWRRVRS